MARSSRRAVATPVPAGWSAAPRSIYVAIAIVLTAVAALAVNLPDAHETLAFDGNEVVGGWCRYDCTWYREIADHGYSYIEGVQSSVAFFPGYPLVARPLARAIDNTPLALIVVTWVAGLATLMLFAHWCARRLERRHRAPRRRLLRALSVRLVPLRRGLRRRAVPRARDRRVRAPRSRSAAVGRARRRGRGGDAPDRCRGGRRPAAARDRTTGRAAGAWRPTSRAASRPSSGSRPG